MGPGISSNYDNITYVFNAGCWKVHSAIHKVDNERVCLWEIDKDELDKMITDEAMQNEYLQKLLDGIQKCKKLRHPNVLKILEIQDNLSKLSFCSEPVSSTLEALISDLKMDAGYIGYQIMNALSFLHNDAKMIHLGLCPSSMFLNESLDIKLFGFNWAINYVPETYPVQLPFYSYKIGLLYPNPNYVAPEIVNRSICYPQSDLYSFGCIMYEMLYGKTLRNIHTMNDFNLPIYLNTFSQDIPQEYIHLISTCLQQDFSNRLCSSGLMKHDVFQTTQVKVLRYLDLIITKDPKDKFGFFKGLSKVIHDFSPMTMRVKILPVLIKECKADIRFAPVLLGTIFAMSEKFTVTEFTNYIFKNISFLINVEDPPQVSIALIQSITLLLDKTDPSLHSDCIYPIIFRALKSNKTVLKKECIKKLPSIIEKLPENIIRTNLLPIIVNLIFSSKDIDSLVSLLSTIPISLKKYDNDAFLLEYFPKVFHSWKNNQNPASSECMLKIIECLNASSKNIMSRALQAASSVASSSFTEPYVKKRLCNWMINTITQFTNTNSLNCSFNKPNIQMPMKKEKIEDPKQTSSLESNKSFDKPTKQFEDLTINSFNNKNNLQNLTQSNSSLNINSNKITTGQNNNDTFDNFTSNNSALNKNISFNNSISLTMNNNNIQQTNNSNSFDFISFNNNNQINSIPSSTQQQNIDLLDLTNSFKTPTNINHNSNDNLFRNKSNDSIHSDNTNSNEFTSNISFFGNDSYSSNHSQNSFFSSDDLLFNNSSTTNNHKNGSLNSLNQSPNNDTSVFRNNQFNSNNNFPFA